MGMPVGLYLVAVGGDAVFSEQYKYNTLKNEVSYGLTRVQVYPVSYTHLKTGRHVLEILRSLYREGTTILLITHDDGIAATARRVVRLSDGKVVADHPQEVDWT